MLGRRHLGEVTAGRRVDLQRLQRGAGNQHRRYDGNRLVNRCSAFDHVVASAEGCLQRLGTDWVDLLLIHWPDHNTPYGEPIEALEKLKQDGKIRHYGVSNFSPAVMDVCESAGHLAANQVGYHLFVRRVERAMLPYTLSYGIGFMAYGTIGFGLLTGGFTESTTFVDWDWRSEGYAFGLPLFQREQFLKQLRMVERLRPIAARHGKSVAQLAISGVLGDPAATVALVGIRRTEETEGERRSGRVAPVPRRMPGNRHHLRRRGCPHSRRNLPNHRTLPPRPLTRRGCRSGAAWQFPTVCAGNWS